jgi:hypothetical protein
MAIDIRATVTCSLGPLIRASVNDDYIQGSGLIKTRGSCEISGLVSPPVGTVVTFNYTKSGLTRNVPRKLRVLSSFADPYRNTTKLELGCKLTYLQDLKEPINWSAFDDPENEDFNQNDTRIATVPILASSIGYECLLSLGIATSGLPLSNKFSIDKFDFSPGYVQILSDLLVSESYCGYLDYNEDLRVFSLGVSSSSGPVFGSNQVIDVAPIGVGELPGDAVVVNYNSLELKAPEDTEIVCRNAEDDTDEFESRWGSDLVSSLGTGEAIFAYRVQGEEDAPLQLRSYSWEETAFESTKYKLYDVYESGKVLPNIVLGKADSMVDRIVDRRNLVTSRSTVRTTGSAGVLGGYAQQSLANGFGFGNFDLVKRTEEYFSYDSFGNETFRSSQTYGSVAHIYGAAGIDFFYTDEEGRVTRVNIGQEEGGLEGITVSSTTSGNTTKRVISRYGSWAETIGGQQAIANARDSITTAGEAQALLSLVFGGGLYLLDVTTEISITGDRGAQEVPDDAEVVKQEQTEDTGDPDNGFRTASNTRLELALGSPTAIRRIELSMPYAPDDTFRRQIVSVDPLRYCFYSTKSDAKQKANLFGRVQNRILFGNRNGMNLQTLPENLPTAPFGAFYLNANGVVTQYRTNGTSWTMDSDGIVASTDALYWGVVGKTA